MHTLLWIIAVILVITGAVIALHGRIALGIAVIIAGFLIGPGGVSITR